jgi:putative PIN family toxin of toxin-antitoxin system
MRVVIDTNVVVSAALKNREPEAVIRFVVQEPACEWIASAEIIAEYADVLGRPKFGLPTELLQQWQSLFSECITLIEGDLSVDFPRDRKDAKFLACALLADADYFVTGDRDFVEAQRLLNTTICSVTQFKRLIIDTRN